MTTLFSSETPLIKSEAFLSYIVKMKGLEMKFWAKKKKEKKKKEKKEDIMKWENTKVMVMSWSLKFGLMN